jgi:uncharacterized BrkB/YihY/UPF0761 family membrane protein
MAQIARRDCPGSRPSQIKLRGWWKILVRVNGHLTTNHRSMVAAGMAFLWLLNTDAFLIDVSNFRVCNRTCGTLAPLIIFSIWLWLSGFIVLPGAELNAQIKRQGQDRNRGDGDA